LSRAERRKKEGIQTVIYLEDIKRCEGKEAVLFIRTLSARPMKRPGKRGYGKERTHRDDPDCQCVDEWSQTDRRTLSDAAGEENR